MTQPPKTQDEWSLHALNIHGVFFERACVNLIGNASNWRVISTNYPVEFPPPNGPWRGKESSLDIWTRREDESHVVDAFIECKKANPEFVNWIFFERTATSDPSQPGIVRIDNMQAEGTSPTWSTSTGIADITTSTTVATDAREVRGDYVNYHGGKKTKTSNASIQDAAYQVALATRALINEESRLLDKARGSREYPAPPWRRKYYVPVICTTARLYIAKFDPKTVNIKSGEIDLDQATLAPTSDILFEYPLPKHLQLTPANPLNALKSGYAEAFSRMHIFVIQSESLVEFLNDLFAPNAGELKNDPRLA